MKTLSEAGFKKLLERAQTIEEDGLGLKVARLVNGDYVKLFRRKRMLSTALWSPPAHRFVKNAKHLQELGIAAPDIEELILIPQLRLEGVRYRPLPGVTLRSHWRELTDAQRDLEIRQFGAFLGHLHQLGIYFRSLHLGNVLKLPDGSIGLIDLSDMRFARHPLSMWKRRRNLAHMLRYAEDTQWLAVAHADALFAGYAEQCGNNAATKLGQHLVALGYGATH